MPVAAIAYALISAALFGVSTPLAKMLLGELPPLLLAGLLYLGRGLGMLAIVAGGAVLSWEQVPRAGSVAGPLLIAGACLGWALDNNFTRRVSGGDAATIACLKGLIAGAVNLALALAQGALLPRAGAI